MVSPVGVARHLMARTGSTLAFADEFEPPGGYVLDLTQVSTQIRSFASDRLRTRPGLDAAISEANSRMEACASAWERTRSRISGSKTSWLVADLHGPTNTVTPAPARPLPSIVFASDGSQIVSDRHDPAACCLLNVGSIVLRYGTDERALLTSRPQLLLPADDLEEEVQGEHIAISPRRMAVRRLLAEVERLADLCREHSSRSLPTLAMCDGTLILWTLDAESEEFRSKSLDTFQRHLNAARQNRIPIVGYISLPQSRDVLNALKVHQCPHDSVNCDRYCPNRGKTGAAYVAPDCAGTEGTTDAMVFSSVLKPGERSAVFGSRSSILNLYEDDNRICFFYMHTGTEVARIEFPAWIARDAALLDQTHALCYDQCQKGAGYPVALAEAHELAIVRGPERDAFFHLMERALVETHQPVATTQKALAKRSRRV